MSKDMATLADLDKRVAVIQTELKQQTRELGSLEHSIELMRKSLGARQTFFYLAALLPVYVLLFVALLGK